MYYSLCSETYAVEITLVVPIAPSDPDGSPTISDDAREPQGQSPQRISANRGAGRRQVWGNSCATIFVRQPYAFDDAGARVVRGDYFEVGDQSSSRRDVEWEFLKDSHGKVRGRAWPP